MNPWMNRRFIALLVIGGAWAMWVGYAVGRLINFSTVAWMG
jgi:hypothetical protein